MPKETWVPKLFEKVFAILLDVDGNREAFIGEVCSGHSTGYVVRLANERYAFIELKDMREIPEEMVKRQQEEKKEAERKKVEVTREQILLALRNLENDEQRLRNDIWWQVFTSLVAIIALGYFIYNAWLTA